MIEPALNTTTPAPQEDVTTTLYRAAIGPVSNRYYLPIFTRFEAADHAGISWNTAAALSTLNWLAFRQLWGEALAYAGALVALVLLIFGIGRLVFQLPDALVHALILGFGLAAFVLPGLFGNAVLHAECRKRMSKALVAHSDLADACAHLTRQASTRRRGIALAIANAVFLVLAVFAYLQLSALSNLAVMPQGALEAGHVVVGRTASITPAASAPVAIVASAPAPPVSAPVTTASAPVAPASAASAPLSAAASAPASAPTAVLAVASAPLPVATASAAIAPRTAPASATAAKAAPSNTMAMVDTMKQNVAKPQALPIPVKNTRVVEVEKPPKAEPKAKPVKPEKLGKPEKPAKTPASVSDKPYFVNVGLFAVAQNAERAHAKLLEAQLPSALKELKSAKGPQIRVRVGPFASKPDAQQAVEKIKALQLDALIVQP